MSKIKPKVLSTQACVSLMQSRRAEKRDEGFLYLLNHIEEHLNEMILYCTENLPSSSLPKNIKSLLLYILGCSKSDKSLPILTKYLQAFDEELTYSAIMALKKIDSKEGRKLLYEIENHSFGDVQKDKLLKEWLKNKQ